MSMNVNINNMKKTIESTELATVKQLFPNNTGDLLVEEMYKFIEFEHLYESAIREVKTKLEILDSEFRTKYSYNPIHHIEDRLKSPKSILEKLRRKDKAFTVEAAKNNLYDVAGVRVICNYIDDIYTVADLLIAQDDVKLIQRKDYIREPKPNGYRSLHLVIQTPVYLSDSKEEVYVEVQIRTIAMDFWASLEHELKYKADTEVSSELAGRLKACAETIAATDSEMQEIYKTLKELN